MSSFLDERLIVLDTETTGLSAEAGHKIIEIGAVELINRKLTNNNYHVYLDPEREVDTEAESVHGLNRDSLIQLSGGKKFKDNANEFLKYIRGNGQKTTVVIHNASFDTSFLDMELKTIGSKTFSEQFSVFCSLKYSQSKNPRSRNTLDALCKRYGIDNSGRELHGALLDSEILAEVFLAMTVTQNNLEMGGVDSSLSDFTSKKSKIQFARISPDVLPFIPEVTCSKEDLERHASIMKRVDKESGGNNLFPEFSF